jgi:hypothetical protein
MGAVTCVLPVSAARCFELLEDPRALRLLVAGAREIRHFDPRWPDPGTTIDHSVGIQPLVIRDRTEVVMCEPGQRLLLHARVQLFGSFSVDFRISPHPEGSELTVEEHATGGLAGLPGLKVAADAAVILRNRWLCRRFRQLVDKREDNAARVGDG